MLFVKGELCQRSSGFVASLMIHLFLSDTFAYYLFLQFLRSRKMIGATSPLAAEPGTIRGDLAIITGKNIMYVFSSLTCPLSSLTRPKVHSD